jgi:hypothetical protein
MGVPWYAAWDLAFHCIPLAMVDPEFAKSQLDLMLSEGYLHSSGQMPAYEWNFGDVNPPVHAFATLFLANLEADLGKVDLPFLQESFAKLLLNFTWWVNRKILPAATCSRAASLGLDNIGVFDRSAMLPGGGRLEQADGTAWMAMFSQNMLELALTLLDHDETYQGFVLKFVEHFFWIAAAVDPLGRKPRRDVGRGGRLFLRRAPSARRHGCAHEGPVPGGVAAAVRHHGDRGRRDRPLSPHRRTRGDLPPAQPGTCWPTSPTRSCPASRAARCCPW